MEKQTGMISVETENIFPIIKKWLYSDKDIFLRELVSNANDAIVKYEKLSSLGEADKEERHRIIITYSKAGKTLSIDDNGIGMTAEEVHKYINQVAFSGARDFMEKYKQEEKSEGNAIIGHFGLGFYSSFMVADRVEIDTLSFEKGAEPVRWHSEGGMTYEISAGKRETRGTTVTLHLAEDCLEYTHEHKLRDILHTYCAFLPVPIYLRDAAKPEGASDKAEKSEEKMINNPSPLWLKNPGSCSEEEYRGFYHEVFHDMEEPLFWIHLNVDYPFRLQGILYFPRMNREFERMEGQIKLYNNQVFVADNIKEVIPEFLLLLKGVIDCPDLPLNVSRSYLQNDGFVRKIAAHITRKVGDKLVSLFNTERESYEKFWDDIHPFIKYGCLRDAKFYEQVKPALLFKCIDGTVKTLGDVLPASDAPEEEKEKERKLFYVEERQQQAQYIAMFREQNMEAVYLDHIIDPAFLQFLEGQEVALRFQRIDSDVSDALRSDVVADEAMQPRFESAMRAASGDDALEVAVETLKSDVPSLMLMDEQSRRFAEMMRLYGGAGAQMPMMGKKKIVINAGSEVIQLLDKKLADGVDMSDICHQVYDLAQLSYAPMSAEGMTQFIARSAKLLAQLVEKIR